MNGYGEDSEAMTSKWMLGGLAAGVAVAIAGCSGFFIDTNKTGGTAFGTSTGDYVYVVNQTTDSLSEYVVGAGTLTAVSGSPIALVSGLQPSSVAVSRPNTYVYVGGTGAITVYSVGAGGALTAVSGGGISAQNANFVALDTSPDGQWLLALDAVSDVVRVYAINATTGVLTVGTALTIASMQGTGTVTPKALRISPLTSANNLYVAVALGGGGTVTFTFNTTTGVLVEAGTQVLPGGLTDNAVSFDATGNYLWVARAGATVGMSGIQEFSLNSGAVPTPVGSLVASGDSPYGLLLESSGNYLYSANRTSGNVNGYTVASGGGLTALPSSPFAGGALETALAEDNTHKYVIGAAYGGSNDITLYALDALTGGKLDALATAVSGSDPAGSIAVAATH